jgi:hypothetical protein
MTLPLRATIAWFFREVLDAESEANQVPLQILRKNSFRANDVLDSVEFLRWSNIFD